MTMASYNYSGVHSAVQDKNSAALLSSGGTATATPAPRTSTTPTRATGPRTTPAAPAYQYNYPDVRAAAHNENVTVYIDGDMPAATKNRHGEPAEIGKGNVYFFELPRVPGYAAGRGEKLPYQIQTTAAAVEPPAAVYYNSSVVAGEALPLPSQVFGGKTTSVPTVAVGHDKVAGRLRRELPVLGLCVASLAVAGLAAGEPTPAAGFGLFLMLIVGLSTVTIRALRE